jgi:hypothetical protein
VTKNMWFKSTKSAAAGHCVEVAKTEENILVRDTKDNGNGPTLSFTKEEWTAFIGGAKDGEFDI